MSKKKSKKKVVDHNPVAKFAHRFNKCIAYKDKKNSYQRKAKHRKADDKSAFSFCTLDFTF